MDVQERNALREYVRPFKVLKRTIDDDIYGCPGCGYESKPHSRGHKRAIRSFRGPIPILYEITFNKYHCLRCDDGDGKIFSHPLDKMAPSAGRYHWNVIDEALSLHFSSGLALEGVTEKFAKDHGLWVPHTTLHDWMELGKLESWVKDYKKDYSDYIVQRKEQLGI